ncbi:unnamed protein product, partial [Heterosigma akashiwo]
WTAGCRPAPCPSCTPRPRSSPPARTSGRRCWSSRWPPGSWRLPPRWPGRSRSPGSSSRRWTHTPSAPAGRRSSGRRRCSPASAAPGWGPRPRPPPRPTPRRTPGRRPAARARARAA